MIKWPFDWYALRAQVAPALISTFPALVLGATLVTWDRFKLADGLAILATTVLLFALAFFARDQGTRIQPRIFPDGLPSLQWIRFRHRKLEAAQKQRVLDFLCSKIGAKVRTADHERLDPAGADLVYNRALKWLRDNTREGPQFKILQNENATYGFYRNMCGMKRIGLVVSAATVITTGAFSAFRYWRDPSYDLSTFFLILGIAIIHAIYLTVAITDDVVKRAADTYAEELYGAAQVVMTNPGLLTAVPASAQAAAIPSAP